MNPIVPTRPDERIITARLPCRCHETGVDIHVGDDFVLRGIKPFALTSIIGVEFVRDLREMQEHYIAFKARKAP